MEKDKKALPKKDTKLKPEKSVKSVATDVPAKDVVRPAKIKAGLKVPSVSFYGTGKRKTSIAKVWLFPGSGLIEINGQTAEAYLPTEIEVKQIRKPLDVVGVFGKFDVKISVLGGGLMGQAGAVQHGISRALLLVDPENRKALKEEGFLTRDPRVKERKKYGRKRARKGFQFRKR
jgi:small subunit ribosomal protein S9